MEKNINTYQTKGANQLKDFDLSKRQVAIYLSTFDVIDADNDMIKKGAFTKSIMERGVDSTSNRKIAFLRYHDWQKQIGKFVELSEDEKGLFAVAQLGTSTGGNDALNDYADGIIREHSIGFQYVTDKIKWIDDTSLDSGGYWMITEVKLFEGSAVTFGANEHTDVVGVMKSEQRMDYASKISNEIDINVKSLLNGKGSDERLFEIEMKIKYLNSQLLLLTKNEPFDLKHSLENKPTETIVNSFNWEQVLKSIN
jgi:HK97 family phage prohead protease